MKNSFIGMGRNPDSVVPDIPMGLGMALFQDEAARKTFESMTDTQKTTLISYIQCADTGDDAKRKISEVVISLREGKSAF